MTWLRIDDKFAEHGKLMALPRSDRWTWLELLCYCARQSSGKVPARIVELLRYATPAFLVRCVDAGLLDRDEDGSLSVHDWAVYNPKDPTGALRASRFRNAKRNTQSNGESNGERNEESNASRVGARARSRPDPPTPIEEGKGREGVEETLAPQPSAQDGRAAAIGRAQTFVTRMWGEYTPAALVEELMNEPRCGGYGLDEASARRLVREREEGVTWLSA